MPHLRNSFIVAKVGLRARARTLFPCRPKLVILSEVEGSVVALPGSHCSRLGGASILRSDIVYQTIKARSIKLFALTRIEAHVGY